MIGERFDGKVNLIGAGQGGAKLGECVGEGVEVELDLMVNCIR